MQRLDVIHEVNNLAPKAERYVEYEQAAEEDFITNEDEIRAIIRRAVTMSWKDSVFTLDELHGHLINNFVKYPVPAGEERQWLEDAVYDLWRTQKEMARLAAAAMPTIVNTKIEGKRHYGIVSPIVENDMAAATESSLENSSAQTEPAVDVDEAEIMVAKEEVVPLKKTAIKERRIDVPALRPSDIAARIFQEYIGSKEESPRFEKSYLMTLFKSEGLEVPSKEVRDVIDAMADSGYIRSYTTGRNKSRRTWWCMDHDVKADVITDIDDGTFHACLPDIFDVEESVA